MDKYDRSLTVVLIGHNIVSIALSVISTILFINLFNLVFDETTISILSSVIMAFVVYLIGDTLPKTIARAIPDTVSLIFAYPTYVLCIILFPVAVSFELIGKFIDSIFNKNAKGDFTEQDFENVVEEGMDQGVLEEEQQEMIQSAIEFSSTRVKEVFTPIENMTAIDIHDLTHEKLQELLLDITYSRIPVYNRDYEHFIGVLLVKKYLKAYLKNPNKPIKSCLIKPYYVAQSVTLTDLFKGFKRHHTHLAFVVNTSKRVIGMVTMEDVLEELIPDISEPRTRRVRRSKQ